MTYTEYEAVLRKRKDAGFGLYPNCLVRKIDVREAALTAVIQLLRHQQANPEIQKKER